ncbi:UNVERIFIED_CONTAM: hypothetical protein FKN15_052611 [Acipenser sinensis]
MKETTAKRREKQREAKPGKQPEKGPEPQDVEMPEEDASAAGKPHKELDTLTLEERPAVLSILPMDTEGEVPFRPRTGKAAAAPLLPEVEAYLQLLLVVYLTNNKRYAEAQKVSDELLQKISSQNRRALDLVAAKCYYYHSRVSEFLSELDIVRSFLHARLRTATLRHDADGQATLLNLLLRNYLQYSLYDQAEKLVSKSVFPELANNNEWARYLYYTDIREHVKQIEKAVSGKEPRFVLRALRALPSTSRRLNPNVLHKAVSGFFTSHAEGRDFLLSFLEEPMDTEGEVQFRPRTGKAAAAPLLPEVEAYLQLLLVVYLTNNKRYAEAQKVSDELLQKISSQNRRALDLVAAKCYYYHSRVSEFLSELDIVRSFLHARLRTATLRHDADGQATLLNLLLRNYLQYSLYDQAEKLVSKSVFPELANNNEWARYLYYTGHFLHARLRTATLRHDADGQATLLNLLLRNYLQYSLYDQAEKLVSKSVFPELANNNEWARYLYYTGRIKAIQLEYSEARRTLTNALRKAPQHTAVGFKQTLLIVVELLLGEIPDRLQFRQPSLKRSLMPYFLLTQAVRMGNLAKFNQALEEFGEKFQTDGTYTLIIRLRHNVIKTGVRMISLSYSRISLSDIAQKLQLDSPEDAEFIVAKAIRDGVIEASINHEKGYVQSKETIDIYGTREPQLAFHQRISFCLDIHNMSVKAMRFPPKSYNKDLESAEERREREQQDLEFAKEMAEDDDDSFP